MRLYGTDAIKIKEIVNSVELNKFSDPTEEERFDISVEEAETICSDDASLVYADLD